MPVFLVAPDDPHTVALPARIHEHIPSGDLLHLPGGTWLISYSGTTKDLSDLIGITTGETTAGVVLLVQSFYGRATPDVWEWLNKKTRG